MLDTAASWDSASPVIKLTKKRKLTSLSSFQDRIDAIKPGSATPMFMVGLILGERLSDECAISTVTSRKTGARVYDKRTWHS
ncbi:Hypp9264 [Branchiostoma lanceolatum]|uniref:Hypp9264 protein n=1 Tax=Branchiostoma lanceolatum TaxID=7740 RepID=A0A8J9ZFW3_BRALA|nr:Hypp9264 [Branchiostoma lanceolatum]